MNSSRIIPDFLGIGAERAGTSWIYACLQEHPEICMPYKELHFFSREHNWSKSLDWYRSQFSSCALHHLTGEYSTSYLSSPEAPERIHSHLPDVKFIVSLRDPIDRAYSSYQNDRASGDLGINFSFGEALRKDQKYLEMSKYAKHLENYFDIFDRDHFLLLVYENCLEDPECFINKIFKFLDVNTSFEPTMLNRRVNEQFEPIHPRLNRLQNLISKIFRSSTLTRPVWWFLKTTGFGSFLRSLYSRKTDQESGPRDEPRKWLKENLESDVRRLKEMVDLPLHHWSDNFPFMSKTHSSNA